MSKYTLWTEDAIEEMRKSDQTKALNKIDVSIGRNKWFWKIKERVEKG